MSKRQRIFGLEPVLGLRGNEDIEGKPEDHTDTQDQEGHEDKSEDENEEDHEELSGDAKTSGYEKEQASDSEDGQASDDGDMLASQDEDQEASEDEDEQSTEDEHEVDETGQLSQAERTPQSTQARESACVICRIIFVKTPTTYQWIRVLWSDEQGPCTDKRSPRWMVDRKERLARRLKFNVSSVSDPMRFLEPGEEWGKGGLRAPNGLYIQQSSKRGCMFCQQAWRAFQRRRIEHEAQQYVWIGSTPMTLSSGGDNFTDNIPNSSIDLCRLWIDQCIESHEQCRASYHHVGLVPTASRLYPSRIINVSTNPPRLCLTKDISPGVRYATLSHCWGTSYSEKQLLKHDKLDTFQQSLPMVDLPKTFQEAILFTQKILSKYDVHYLWIDSLCIIQNSTEDWLEESARMSGVYANAFCNIAATASHDGSGGLFYPRYTELGHYTIMNLDVPSAHKRKSQREDCIVTLADQWHRVARNSPLNRRAWVFQERLLSPRIIHFAEDMLYWQCTSHTASEDLHHGRLRTTEVWEQACKELVLRLPVERPPSQEYIQSIRQRMVEEYMECKITYADDRLQAFSGIAALFQRRFEDGEYRYDEENAVNTPCDECSLVELGVLEPFGTLLLV
ncbi:hypothetical protein MBLNU457_g0999t3 [Dothideomycetes sp. NU457]